MSNVVVINHQTEAISRVATQYTEAAKFLSTLRALAGRCQDIEDALIQVSQIADIDIATGVNLDVIGDIVGVSRYIPESIALPFFGFDDTPGGKRLGEEVLPWVGSRFREELESAFASTVLADPEFRLLIKAKIIRNHAVGTVEDFLNSLTILFSTGADAPMYCEDCGGMGVKVAIGRSLSELEVAFLTKLDILPRPAAVQLVEIATYDPDQFFGFDDQAGALGFGEEGDSPIMDGTYIMDATIYMNEVVGSPSIGGLFAEDVPL